MTARFSTLLLAGLFAAACTADTADQETADASAEMSAASADEAALEQLRADYVDHYNQHHASVVTDMYTDSAVGLWADGTVTVGKAAILADLEQEMAGSPTLTLETGAVMVFGDHAVSRGAYGVATPAEGGATVNVGGNYLAHFRKIDGQWKINGVASNFNAPPPEGMPLGEMSGEPPPDEGTMGDLIGAYVQRFNAGDWPGLASLYAEDAVAGFTNAPLVEGRAAILARFQERFPTGPQQIEIHDVGTLDLGGGWALDGGWFTASGTTAEGNITQSGTYFNLLRQQPDGSWVIQWHVSNGQPKPAT